VRTKDKTYEEQWFIMNQERERMRVFLFIIKSIKREVKTRPMYGCRCDERLKPEGEESTFLGYPGFLGELEHLKIETRLIDEKFASVVGECLI
jgi:hypothetical protein